MASPPVFNVPPSTPVDSNPAANSVTEGAAVNTLVGVTAFSTDPDSPTVTYSLIGDSSGGGFKIDPATGVVSVADPTKINFESPVGHAYPIIVQASDGISTSAQSFTINVNDVAPSVPVDGDVTADIVAEGAAVNTLVGITAVATDVNGPSVTWSLTGDSSGGGFKIDPVTGVISVADPSKINFESTAVHAYSVTATASDGALTSSRVFSISVADVAPSTPVDGNTAADLVAEGAPVNTLVGITAVAADVNGPGVTWSLTGDSSGGGFKIDPVTGVISVADPSKINFESTAVHAYSVTATASDGALTSSRVFSISVADGQPSTPLDGNPAANSVLEGAATGTAVGITAVSTDVNGPGVTWSLIGDTSNGGFTIDATTGVITVANPSKIDYESAPGFAYTVTAQASDGTLTSAQTFTIYVQDVAPSVPIDANSAPNVVAEGAAIGTTIGITAFSTDVNSPGVTWSLIGDTSNGGFTIDAATGVVTVADPTKIDYETAGGHVYTVTAQASDGALKPAKTFTINVTDVALSTPTDTNTAGNSVAEGAANGTAVGITASAVDPNGPATTYSLTGDTSNGGFTINAATGVVTVANSAKLDYESAVAHAYSITVQAQVGAQITSQAFSIGVTDVAPSAPTDLDGAANLIPTHAANGSSAHIHAASADVNGGTVTFSIVSDTSGGGFAIDLNSGIVTIADSTKIDYNTPGHAYTIKVAASDGALSSTTDFVIDISPNTPPTAVNDTATMGENQTIDVDVLANDTDPDPGDTKTLVSFGAPIITGPAGAVFGTPTFSVVANQMHIVPGTAFDTLGAGETGTMTVSYTMQDTAGAQSTATVTVTINGADDLPAAVADNLSMSEDAAAGTPFNVIANDTQDADHTAANTISLLAGMTATGPAGTSIDPTDVTASIVANQVQISLGTDFQKLAAGETATIIVPYRLTGDAGETSDSTLTVTVNGANDTPTANADTGSMSEDAAATPFDVILNDVKDTDHTAANTISLLAGMTATGPAGTNIDPTDVTASIVANQIQISLGADFQKLAAGETATIIVPYSLTGDAGDSSNSTLTVTVNGANDVPTANADTGSMSEDDATQFDVFLNDVQDADHTAANTINVLAGMTATGPAGTNIDPTDVTVVVASNQMQISLGADFQKLAAGETATIIVPYRLTGDAGDTSDSTLTVTVNGANDTPTATADTGSMGEDDAPTPFDVIGNDIQDADHTASNTITVLAGTTASDPGGTTIDGADVTATVVGGQIQITLGSDFQQLDFGQSSTIIVPYRLTGDAGDTSDSTLTITVSGRNDAPTLTATANNPTYSPAADLFSTPSASTIEPGQKIDQLVLTVTNVSGTANDFLTIDGTQVDLVDGNSVPTSTPGLTASVTFAGGTATVTVASSTGGITATDLATLVDGISYTETTVSPGDLPRTVTITSLHDTGGTLGGGSDTATLNIASTVSFNVAPIIDSDGAGATASKSVAENTTAVTTVLAHDPDGGPSPIAFSIVPGDDGAKFGIDSNGHLVFLTAPDFENPTDTADTAGNNTYVVTVRASDGASFDDQTITVTVTDVNEAPVITSNGGGDTASINVNENSTTVTTVTATDQDVPAQTLTYSLVTGAGSPDKAKFTIDGAGHLSFITAPNFEVPTDANADNDYVVQVQVTDNGVNPANLSDIQTITVHVQNVNEAPDTASVTMTGNEDPTGPAYIPITITGTDVDAGDSVASFHITNVPNTGTQGTLYSDIGLTTQVTEGADVTATGNAATLYFVPNANFNTHAGAVTFNAAATDTHSLTDATPGTETINITAVNDGPVNTAPANSDLGTAFSNTDFAVSGFSVVDVDAGDSVPGDIHVTLAATHGNVSVTLNGTTVTSGTNGSHSVTLDGTVAQVNAALNSLIYHSDDGYTGTDTVTLHTDDLGHTGAGGAKTADASVDIGIVPQVFIIDNTAGGTGGTGTIADPFKTINDFNTNAADGSGDYIYIKHGATGTYSEADGINLLGGEHLYGQGQTLTFTNPVTGQVVTIGTGSTGNTPTISVTGANQHGIDLGADDQVTGLNVSTTLANQIGIHDSGASVGTVSGLTVSDVDVTGAGQAVNIAHGGLLNVAIDTLTSTGSSTNGIHLGTNLGGTALTGSFSAGTGANAAGSSISGSTGTGFLVGDGAGSVSTGGTATVNFGGAISASNAGLIDIQDHATGAVTLSGTLTHTGTGAGIVMDDNSSNFTYSGTSNSLNTGASTAINITNQSGGTVGFSSPLNIDTTSGAGINIGGTNTGTFNFTGGNVTIDTTGGAGFSAAGGGTLSVTGSGNTISTGTGAIVNMSGIALGASGVTFGSLQSTGTVNSNAITLNNVDGNTFTSGGTSIAATSGAGSDGIHISGGSSSTFNFNGTTTVSNASGDGINLSGANGAVSFNSVALNGMNGDAVDVSGNTNSVTVSGGSIGSTNDPGGVGVKVGTGTGDVSVAASITKSSAGHSVDVSGHTGGTVGFSAAISGTGAVDDGISLSSNTGTTMNFSGGMTLTTGAGAAFSATGGGTVNVTNGANNHLTTTTGTALNIANTTIGGSNVTFHDISANGAVNGIVLNNTGSGTFTVTGDGASDSANTTRGQTTAKLGGGSVGITSGGTITATTGAGVSLTNTNAVTLRDMQVTNGNDGIGAISDNGHDGINANTVSGLTLDNVKVSGFADNYGIKGTSVSGLTLQHVEGSANATTANVENVDIWGVLLKNLSGTVAVNNSLFFNSREDVFTIDNTNTNANVTVGNSEFRDVLQAAGGNTAFAVITHGNSVTNLTATGSLFQNARTTGLQYAGNDTSSGSVTVTGNTFNQNGVDLDIAHQGAGTTLNFDVENNTLRQTFKSGSSSSINIFLGGLSTAGTLLSGKVVNNTIGAVGVANSGSDLGAGIGMSATGAGTLTATVTGNTVNQVRANSGNVFDLATSQTAKANLFLHNNTFNGNPAQLNPQYGIHINAGTGTPGETNQLYLDMGGNVVNMPASAIANLDLDVFPGTLTKLFGYAGGADNGTGTNAAAIQAFLQSTYSSTTGPAALYTPAGGQTQGTATPFSFPLLAAAGGVQASSPTPGEMHLTQAQLDSVVAAAIAQWEHAGASAAQLAALHATTFSVADLSGDAVGEQGPGAHIVIDKDAAGHGWFVDATPNDNSEFTHAQNAEGTDLLTDPSNAAAGHLDLLTTVTHELGHVLGLDDTTAASTAHDLMYIGLVDGERRLPDANDVTQADSANAAQTAEAALPVSAQAVAGTPIVIGTAGNDTINAGNGGNVLFGGAGADTFVFGPSIQLNAPTPAQITHVADYSAAQGDTFDFSGLTSAFHNSSVNDSLVVRAVEDASGKFATLQVDHIDPMGLPSAPNWVNVAQLDGAHAGDSVNVLIDSHSSVHLAQIHVDLLV